MGHKGDSLGDRMKGYESVSRNFLTKKLPAIIRIDGKAFHSFTKGFDKPFDAILGLVMQETMKRLCENIQGCVLGYTQSDEITLVLTDYESIRTEAWFGYNVQKMTSISASMATLYFNQEYRKACFDLFETLPADPAWEETFGKDSCLKYFLNLEDAKKYKLRCSRFDKASFDSRAFSLPKDEVCNCLIWRQQDATRNSIEMVGRAYFSHKQLYKKNINMIQDMLMEQHGINWNNFPTMFKRGSCCIKKEEEYLIDDLGKEKVVIRNKWVIDNEIPIFTQDRNYIESRI